MRRLALLLIAAVVIVAGCGGSEDSLADTVPTVDIAPTSEPVRQTDPPEEDLSAVPFPPPRDLVTYEQREPLVLGSPPSIFDFYDDIAETEDFVVYQGERGQVLMTDAFVKEGLTYGYVTWTVDGVTQSTSSGASNELAMCAADVLAVSMDRFDAEVLARGVIENDDAGGLRELFDLYIECGGTEELLTLYVDELRLNSEAIVDIACVEATVTTEAHLRIVTAANEDSFDDFVNLVGPCFNWSGLPFALEDTSLLCLQTRSVDGLRSSIASDFPGFRAILESCLTAAELAQIPG